MLFLGIFHLQAFCCLLISLKMERISWAGSLHGAELFPAEQLPSGHGNQKYAPTVWDNGIHAAPILQRHHWLNSLQSTTVDVSKMALFIHYSFIGEIRLLQLISFSVVWNLESLPSFCLYFTTGWQCVFPPDVCETKNRHRAHIELQFTQKCNCICIQVHLVETCWKPNESRVSVHVRGPAVASTKVIPSSAHWSEPHVWKLWKG